MEKYEKTPGMISSETVNTTSKSLYSKVLERAIKGASIVVSVAAGDYSGVLHKSFNTEANVAASYTSEKVQGVQGNWNIIAPRKK